MNRAVINFRVSACRAYSRRSNRQIRRGCGRRIAHRNAATFFNVIHDGLRKAQLARGRLVGHLVAVFSHGESDNSASILEHNSIRACRGRCEPESHGHHEDGPHTKDLAHPSILSGFATWTATALFRNAECDYTSYMRPGLALFVLSCLVMPPVSPAGEEPPHKLYEELNALRLAPGATYQIVSANRIELRRGGVELYFEEGKLAFFAPLDGHITGFVFLGRGHILAFPRELVEKQQMARFLGAPVLDQEFLSAYVRFTDDAAEDLLQQFQSAKLAPQTDTAYDSLSDPFLARFNPSQSLRILEDRLTQNPKPYFYAALEGEQTGTFDLLFDPQHREQVFMGQRRKNGDLTYYDVWASYNVPGAVPPAVDFRALDYTIDTKILPDNSLDATAAVHIRAETSGERVMTFQLSRALRAERVTDGDSHPLDYFQNEGMNLRESSVRGNDYLHVVLPQFSQKGEELTIRFHYRGSVIEDAGNGVLFVGARESWYPHLGDQADFASYDLTMRWPRHLKLVATGAKIDERSAGDFRVGHWRSDKPLAIAGFNLGEYASSSLANEARTIDVYANRQLEQALSNRLDTQTPVRFRPWIYRFVYLAETAAPPCSHRRRAPPTRSSNSAKKSTLRFAFMKTSAGLFRFAR